MKVLIVGIKKKAMLQHKTFTILLILMAMVLFVTQSPAQPSSLEITIVNIEKNSGKIVIEIYKDKSAWLKSPLRTITLSTDEGSKRASFNLAYGRYAISVYQDRNENGELDRTFIGIPKEAVGFGNNYKPFGKPGYEAALVEHKPGSKPEAIKLFTVF